MENLLNTSNETIERPMLKEEKEMRKSVIAVFATLVILLSFLGPAFYLQSVQAADPTEWYATVPGVLHNDTYTLYPYLSKSLTFGFSKFGELIDGNTKTGLFYDTTDAFAPDTASPPEWQWIEGWILNVTYVEGGQYRNLWAMATYSDYYSSAGIGGDWQEAVTVGPLDLSVRGGRKTSHYAYTQPIEVLYDGPREFLAMCRTTFYDSPDKILTHALLNLTFTFVFNKVKKEVIVLKDIKRIDVGKNIGDMQIEFGDRGEWDLGAGAPPKSYAHIYMNQTTVYDHNWQPWYNTSIPGYDGTFDVCQLIDDERDYVGWMAFWPKPITTWVGATQLGANRPLILTTMVTVTEDQLGTGTEQFFTIAQGEPVPYPQKNATGIYWIEDPMVFAGGNYKVVNGSDPSTMVTYWPSNNTIKFPTGYIPPDEQIVRIVYKINNSRTDMSSEPNSPFVIGEWAFRMHESPDMFRGVTVYGITDRNDGDDEDRSGGSNVLDREVQYQLDEIFYPWDLESAVHKETKRWVQYELDLVGTSITTDRRPFYYVSDSEWDQYCTFSERVENLTAGTVLNRYDGDYSVTVNTAGYGVISGLTSGHDYKVLYSTKPEVTETLDDWVKTYLNQTDWNWGCNSTTISGLSLNETWTDGLGAGHSYEVVFGDFDIHLADNTTDWSANWSKTWTWNETDFKVFRDETYLSVLGGLHDPINATILHDETEGAHIWNFDIGTISKSVTAPSDLTVTWPLDGETIHVLYLNHSLTVTMTFEYNATEERLIFTGWFNMTVNYKMKHMGRYEWGIVGRESDPIDCVGLGAVTAAFKNKQIEYGVGGEDMYDNEIPNQGKWVMAKYGTGHTKADYYYSGTDYRTALKNDWCTSWAITTSNMISVGGPIANMHAYYGNDFPAAFFALGQFTDYTPWENKISAITCWNKKAYASSNTIGYAVISTYKDINGTVLFMIWGHWGRDTEAVSNWFDKHGIYQLQQAPAGVTSIIVKIPYTLTEGEGYKPGTITIVEVLGTISERLWTHCLEDKGGIHDP